MPPCHTWAGEPVGSRELGWARGSCLGDDSLGLNGLGESRRSEPARLHGGSRSRWKILGDGPLAVLAALIMSNWLGWGTRACELMSLQGLWVEDPWCLEVLGRGLRLMSPRGCMEGLDLGEGVP